MVVVVVGCDIYLREKAFQFFQKIEFKCNHRYGQDLSFNETL
tara:strand:+ start:2346 stop:2471 length:126 start_codon:yes stop_codon:yes gene_type:complete